MTKNEEVARVLIICLNMLRKERFTDEEIVSDFTNILDRHYPPVPEEAKDTLVKIAAKLLTVTDKTIDDAAVLIQSYAEQYAAKQTAIIPAYELCQKIGWCDACNTWVYPGPYESMRYIISLDGKPALFHFYKLGHEGQDVMVWCGPISKIKEEAKQGEVKK